ncbi:MAG TPA: D-isomer specific 2-hydroxyacid dehydrogenase family protein [Cryptosporangiaceae bacterium]|nr:D-isomer specific 2-hydroxyacid dehydrogenase family protein [Cryptosporangiaceae bacterium]
MRPSHRLRCAVYPGPITTVLAEAITVAGGELVDVAEAEILVWTDPFDADGLAELLVTRPDIRWVQLPFAGVDRFAGLFGDDRTWTSTKGAYSEPVAEHALALGLAGLRQLPQRARATTWGSPGGIELRGSPVTVVGGGGITEALLRLLSPFHVEATVVRRHVAPIEGAARVVGREDLSGALAGARLVVLALALTPETAGIMGAAELRGMDDDAWLVNVARGAHVVTADLVSALRDGIIGGAALDVTDPEPLPAGHPLWTLDNCIITPHTANTWQMAQPLFAERVGSNVGRYLRKEPLLGRVDPELGY